MNGALIKHFTVYSSQSSETDVKEMTAAGARACSAECATELDTVKERV
jgi:hypothetical protein